MNLNGMKCCLNDYAYEKNVSWLSNLETLLMKRIISLTDYSSGGLNCVGMSASTLYQASLGGVYALHGSDADGGRRIDREATCPDLIVHVGGDPSLDACWSARVNRFADDDEMTSNLSVGACVATHHHLAPMSLFC